MSILSQQTLLFVTLVGCTSNNPDGPGDAFVASLEEKDGVTILRVGGDPYDMGYQHGDLLHDKLVEGAQWIDASYLALMEPLAEYYGLIDEAYANSFDDVVQECQGLVDAIDDEDVWGMDRCMLLAYGDPVLETLSHQMGCSQFIAKGTATTAGQVIHGRNLDWSEISFIVENPTLIVRHPAGGIANVVLGFPGNISPFSGINANGLALASNEAYGIAVPDGEGHAHSQMSHQMLQSLSTVAEARAFLQAEDHISAEIIAISDATGDAAVFEMAVDGMDERTLSQEDTVYVTNHFLGDVTEPLHEVVTNEDNSVMRYARLEQLLEPGGADSVHGTLDLAAAVGVLRDTYNPVTDVLHSPDLFDGGGTLANNGAIQALVFLPEQPALYVAIGELPLLPNPFVGFTLEWLLGQSNENTPVPLTIP